MRNITIEDFNNEVDANRQFAKTTEQDGFNILEIDTMFGTVIEKININFKPLLAQIVSNRPAVKPTNRKAVQKIICPDCGRVMKPTTTGDITLSVIECKKCRYSLIVNEEVNK